MWIVLLNAFLLDSGVYSSEKHYKVFENLYNEIIIKHTTSREPVRQIRIHDFHCLFESFYLLIYLFTPRIQKITVGWRKNDVLLESEYQFMKLLIEWMLYIH
jgi:hypothetical protein